MASIVVLTTGGTIASRRDAGAAVATETGGQLLRTLPNRPPDLSLTIYDVVSVDSSALTLAQLDSISEAVSNALRTPAVDGVVVTHGTDTMEETALLIDLSHHDPRPVVFTGAQRTADDPHPDGPGNLAHAITVAADPSMRNRGVLIAFADAVLPARGVLKISTDAPQPFAAAPLQPRRIILPPKPIAPVRVDTIASYPGADGSLIQAALDAGARGIVLEGTGSGNTTAAVMQAVRQAISGGVPVVVTSRVATGPLIPTYGGGSGAHDLLDSGAIIATQLRAGQCRIALAALLASDAQPDTMRDFFSGLG